MHALLKRHEFLGFVCSVAFLLVACGGDRRQPVIGTSEGVDRTATAPVASAGAPDAGVDGADEEEELEEAPEEPPLPDISTLHASTRTDAPPLGLTLDVAEKGPGQPWAVAIVNEGSEPVRLVADSRLLWFDVVVPGKRRPVTCRLPDALFPADVEERLTVVLNPGEGVVQAFDARLYCFAVGGQRALVPGALVRPYFGWQDRTKRPVARLRRKAAPAKQGPFVATRVDAARRAPADESDAGSTSSEADGELKQIEGQPFALRSEYKEWSSTQLAADEPLRRAPGPLELALTQGSDAQAERNALISLSLRNRSDRTQSVYFRREFVSFEVVGPDGVVSCDPQPDDRAPDRQAFSVLRKKGSMAVTSRLIELCPQGTFARPGLYLVHARFDANEDGDQFGLNAFVGRVVSLRPAAVRIRTGEVPFLRKQPMRSIRIVDEDESNEKPPR
jgi:hypothetical protein